MLGHGLDADEAYLEVCKLAGFPQAGAWVLGTMGGILAGRYGLGPLLHAPVDAILPDAAADPEMVDRVANTTGAFIGGNLGGALGYNLSGQRAPDVSPAGVLRSAAGMTPTGVYDHPDEIPSWRNLRRKTAGIGAGLARADTQSLSHAIPAFGSWLVPTMGGILAGATLGDLAGPELAHLTPEGTAEAGQHVGRMAGGLLGGTAGSMLGYKLNETEEAPDVTPVGITSIAAGVPVDADRPGVELLSGTNTPQKAAAQGTNDAQPAIS